MIMEIRIWCRTLERYHNQQTGIFMEMSKAGMDTNDTYDIFRHPSTLELVIRQDDEIIKNHQRENFRFAEKDYLQETYSYGYVC